MMEMEGYIHMLAKQGLVPRGTCRFDIVQAWYWYLAYYHEGQWDDNYRRLCKVSRYYKPGIMEMGPTSDAAKMIYDTLINSEEV